MQARMRNPALVLESALQPLLAVGKASENCGVPALTLKLTHLRASQINGCGFCVDMHAKELKKLGASDERIFALSAWHEAPYFSPEERAALALTDAMTRLNDRSDAVPDSVWQEASKYYDERALSALIMSIALVNLWNRLNVTTKQVAGAWR